MTDFLLTSLNPTTAAAAANGFADQPTPEEQRALGVMYDRAPEQLEPGEFYSNQGMLRTTFDQNFVK